MALNSKINKTEYKFLKYLSMSLKQTHTNDSVFISDEDELNQILFYADCHEVVPLLESVLTLDNIPQEQQMIIQMKIAKTVHKAIQLQALNAKLTTLLQKDNIQAITLKGCAISRFYPISEYRKTTDIDIFVANSQDIKKTVQILYLNGFQLSQQWHANHHFVFISKNKEVVELHTTWTESFKDNHINQYINKIQQESIQHYQLIEHQGLKVYAYETAWQGFYLMIHMLQHFVGSGFGLRNLCDWVVLWEDCEDEQARERFWKMACESHTTEFSKAITSLCVRYLGLSLLKSPVPHIDIVDQELSDALLRDILDAGEFGYSEPERMVGMDGNSLSSYIKEFHHQMHINFPHIGNIILLWPVLWIFTLLRFLNNNKKLHRAPVSEIMKKAGNRGQLVKRLTSQ